MTTDDPKPEMIRPIFQNCKSQDSLYLSLYHALHGKANWPTSGDGATDKFIPNFFKKFYQLLYYLFRIMYFFADIK